MDYRRKLRSMLYGASKVMQISPPPLGEINYAEDILSVSDEDALRGDWEAVGRDIRDAMDREDHERRD